jgi:hypothetical protein
MLSGIKRMLVNLFKENKKLFCIIGGAIALPLALAIVIGVVFALGAFLVMLGLDVYQSIILMILMIFGGIGGHIVYDAFRDEG